MSQIPPPPGLATDPHPGRSIVSSSRALLRQDKSLSLLPLIGGLSSLLAGLPLVVAQLVFKHQTTIQYVLYALTVLIGTSVITFFSVALAAGAATRMDGGDPTISSSIAVAMGNLWSIVRWAVFATIIGLILRPIESRMKNGIGSVVSSLGGATFAVASYFVIPMLAHEKIGPINALKKSASTVRGQWRKALRFNLRLGLWALLVVVASGAICAATIWGGVRIGLANNATGPNVGLGIAIALAGMILFIWAMLYINAVNAYGRTALYRFATGRPVPGFSSEALQGAAKVADTVS